MAVDGSDIHHGLPVDMWALGILIMFVVDSRGRHHFHGLDQEQVNDRVDGICMNSDMKLTASAQRFLKECLKINPDERLTAYQAEKHGWFRAKAHRGRLKKLRARIEASWNSTRRVFSMVETIPDVSNVGHSLKPSLKKEVSSTQQKTIGKHLELACSKRPAMALAGNCAGLTDRKKANQSRMRAPSGQRNQVSLLSKYLDHVELEKEESSPPVGHGLLSPLQSISETLPIHDRGEVSEEEELFSKRTKRQKRTDLQNEIGSGNRLLRMQKGCEEKWGWKHSRLRPRFGVQKGVSTLGH